jgi:signal peptidase II
MSSASSRPPVLRAFVLSLVVLIADQSSKAAVLSHFDALTRCPNGSPASVLCDEPFMPLINLTMVWNPGVSMGMIQHGTELARWGITLVTALITLVVGWWLTRERDPVQRFAFALVLGGAIGNIIDRVRFGAVADFIRFTPDLPLIGQFWVFNVADAAISLGVVLLLLRSFWPQRKPVEPASPREGHDA